ncbi:MAG: NAD(P)/FAD-dependent oxidoreductase [Patescibacteria group bacterium]
MGKIVILGGGFAGVAAGLTLSRNIPEGFSVTIIDKNSFHTFTPSLYEVASSEEPQKNIAIPFSEIFQKNVEIIKAEVEKIDERKKKIILKDKRIIDFDYLVISLGSEPAFYGIQGLKDYSFPLKTVADAVRIKDEIHKACDKKALEGEKINIIVGGGGFAGTELAAEILCYDDLLSKEHKIDSKSFDVFIIQGSDKLLKELDEHVSNTATNRLQKLGARFIFGSHIKEVSKNSLRTDKGENFSFDILIWTGGVKANSLLEISGLPLSKSGEVIVNEYLQAKDFPNIFVAGDIAEFTDAKTQKKAPGVAQVAEDEGRVAGENIVSLIEKKSLKPYKLRHFGYLIPLRGRYAVFTSGMLHIKGFFGWIIQQIVVLRYFLGILPFPKDLKRWNDFEKDLRQE